MRINLNAAAPGLLLVPQRLSQIATTSEIRSSARPKEVPGSEDGTTVSANRFSALFQLPPTGLWTR
jgi:hypothetical protein